MKRWSPPLWDIKSFFYRFEKRTQFVFVFPLFHRSLLPSISACKPDITALGYALNRSAVLNPYGPAI